MTVVEVRAVAKRWSDAAGLAETSLTVAPGELVVIRGRSGSGKSTLLAILAGWCRADSGEVVWNVEHQRWTGVALVPQVLGLLDELTAAENIEIGLRRLPVAEREARVTDLAASLDLADFLDRRPPELSMGQRQRVAVARALAVRPACVLIDEPTSHQDATHAAGLIAVLRDHVENGASALVATHDELVIEAADRVISLGH